MLQELYCEIAGHRFTVETPDKELTTMLLPSFRPFWIERDAASEEAWVPRGAWETLPTGEAAGRMEIGEIRETDETREIDKIRETDETGRTDKTVVTHNNGTSSTNSESRTTKLLFRFSGNKDIPVPETEPVETMDFEGTKFHVYRTAKGTTISMRIEEKVHYMFASEDRTIFKSDLTLVKREENRFLLYLLRAAYGMAAIHHQTIKIHASVTEKEGKALIFLGKSGTGKSTHSRLWKEFVPESSLLNDDEPIVRLLNDGSVRVYGAPWSGSTPCYRNASAKVSAFVHLYQSAENKLTRLKGVEAFTSLFQSSALLRSDEKGRQLAFDLITDILGKVPYYRLDNRPDREAVSLTETLMG